MGVSVLACVGESLCACVCVGVPVCVCACVCLCVFPYLRVFVC